MEKSTVLTIEKLAGLGDGVAMFEGQKIFVPYTMAGDVVRAKVPQKASADGIHAVLEAIVKASPDRRAAVCKHFSDCGGCSLQHLKEGVYNEFKFGMAEAAVRKAGFDPACVAPLVTLPPARRRVELKAEDGALGFHAERSHRLVEIDECKVLEPSLEAVVLWLKKQLVNWPHITGAQINGVDGGYDVVLECQGSNPFKVTAGPGIKRVSMRVGADWKTLFKAGEVTISFAGVTVEVPPGAFLQASREAQTLMTELVVKAVNGAPKVMDLFAGLGTYSFPLAAHSEVMAVEGDAAMVAAMRDTTLKKSLHKPFKTLRRDLFANPISAMELSGYDAVVINPPRLGAKAQCANLSSAKVKKLVMISCNPATFARDARILKEGGYQLDRVTPIDQFAYSSHLELVAEFSV